MKAYTSVVVVNYEDGDENIREALEASGGKFTHGPITIMTKGDNSGFCAVITVERDTPEPTSPEETAAFEESISEETKAQVQDVVNAMLNKFKELDVIRAKIKAISDTNPPMYTFNTSVPYTDPNYLVTAYGSIAKDFNEKNPFGLAICEFTGALRRANLMNNINLYASRFYLAPTVVINYATLRNQNIYALLDDPVLQPQEVRSRKGTYWLTKEEFDKLEFEFNEFHDSKVPKGDLMDLFGVKRIPCFSVLTDGLGEGKAYPADLQAARYGTGKRVYSLSKSADRQADLLRAPVHKAANAYSTKAEYLFGFMANGKVTEKPQPNTMYFGMEFELCAQNREIRADHLLSYEPELAKLGFVGCSDGSIADNYGVEFKSAPMDAQTLRERLPAFYDIVEDKLSFGQHASAGLHIHVSRNALTEFQIARIATFMFAPKNAELIKQVARREPNQYCKNNSTIGFANTKGPVKLKSGTHLGRGAGGKPMLSADVDRQRYLLLNLGETSTIEFRLFASAGRIEHALSALEFVEAIIRFTAPGATSLRPFEFAEPHHFRMWLAQQTRYSKDKVNKGETRLLYPNLCKQLGIVPAKSASKKPKKAVVA